MYGGENRLITDGNYDPALAVKCVNGTFVGRKLDETFCRTMRKMWGQFAKTGNPSLTAEQSPDGKAKTWPLYDPQDKRVMLLDDNDIRPAKEADVHIVDWDRTYFLTKYYAL